MARFAFAAGIWVLAATLGVLGYQILTLYFYEDWPAISVGFALQELKAAWDGLFGGFWFIPDRYVMDIPPGGLRKALDWLAGVPFAAAGFAVSYGFFLLADSLKDRGERITR